MPAFGIADIVGHFRNKKKIVGQVLIGVLMLIHAIENVPFPMPAFAASPYIEPPPIYSQYFSDKSGHTIVDLPSNRSYLDFVDMDKSLNSYNRELNYMNWQTRHRQNTVNGLNGYYPKSRFTIRQQIDLLLREQALTALADYGVDYLVFHKNLVLPGEERIGKELGVLHC